MAGARVFGKLCIALTRKQNIRLGSKEKVYIKRWFPVAAFLLVSGIAITLTWLILFFTLPVLQNPKSPLNKVSTLVDEWGTPKDSIDLLSPWQSDFTEGITPISCHSHNDYWRTVPLYEALAAGCMSVEADIYLPTKAASRDLLIGHTQRSLTQDRTLQALYTGPIISILENLNNISAASNATTSSWNGIFQSSPHTTLALLLDFKSNGTKLWPLVNQQLEILRSKKWLTNWNNSTGVTWAPIIVVASGKAPFDLLNANNTYRDIFYDAPLDDISNSVYNNTNSYYASASMSKVLGRQWFWKFSSTQLNKISTQIKAASDKGLKSRYWDTPAWPVVFNEYILGVLVERNIGLLNVDVFSSTLYFPLRTRFSQNRLIW